MSNVLVLSAGRRVELVESFQTEMRSLGIGGKVYAADVEPKLSSACQIADGVIATPRISDPNYIDRLEALCRSHNIALVVPTIDTDLLLLAEAVEKGRFSDTGTIVSISEPSFVRACRDKRLSVEVFRTLEIPCPADFPRSELRFPCFVRPFNGSSSERVVRLSSPDELSNAILADESLMFSEYIGPSYTEYTIDAYFDRSQVLRCAVTRERIAIRAGEVSKSSTRKNWVTEFIESRLGRLNGPKGCITLQIFARSEDQSMYGIEINPRFGGGFPLSYAAGANYPRWLLSEAILGLPVATFDAWVDGLLMLRFDRSLFIPPSAQ